MPAFIYTLPPVIIDALAEERFPFPVLHTLAQEGQVDATRGFELRAATLVDAMFELGDALIDLEAEVESFNLKRVIAGALGLFDGRGTDELLIS